MMLQSFKRLHESKRIRIEQQSCDFAIVNGEFTQKDGRGRSKRKISEITRSCPDGYTDWDVKRACEGGGKQGNSRMQEVVANFLQCLRVRKIFWGIVIKEG